MVTSQTMVFYLDWTADSVIYLDYTLSKHHRTTSPLHSYKCSTQYPKICTFSPWGSILGQEPLTRLLKDDQTNDLSMFGVDQDHLGGGQAP